MWHEDTRVVGVKVAGIDCGTNSIRLLISDVQENNDGLPPKFLDVVRRMEVVRLGQGVDKTGRFAEEALERTFAAVDNYAGLCREHDVESVRFAATSAARDASNRDEFVREIVRRIGVEPQILTGEEEASTSFNGAVSAVSADVKSPVIAVDLGGGSTEIALGEKDGTILGAFSMDVGCVRMHERHLVSEVPTDAQIEAARTDVRDMLDRAEQHVNFGMANALIGLAGTITTLTAQHLGLSSYDSEKIHGASISVKETLDVCEWFLRSTRQERERLGFMHPGRVDVIASGALVWSEVVKRVDQRMRENGKTLEGIITSEHDILDGLAMWAAKERQRPAWG